jgi:hypothetical protein
MASMLAAIKALRRCSASKSSKYFPSLPSPAGAPGVRPLSSRDEAANRKHSARHGTVRLCVNVIGMSGRGSAQSGTTILNSFIPKAQKTIPTRPCFRTVNRPFSHFQTEGLLIASVGVAHGHCDDGLGLECFRKKDGKCAGRACALQYFFRNSSSAALSSSESVVPNCAPLWPMLLLPGCVVSYAQTLTGMFALSL